MQKREPAPCSLGRSFCAFFPSFFDIFPFIVFDRCFVAATPYKAGRSSARCAFSVAFPFRPFYCFFDLATDTCVFFGR